MPSANWSITRRPQLPRAGTRGRTWYLGQAPYVGVAYRVYSNTGAGDPINYGSPIATVATPGFLTPALTYPGTWSFGVRAVDLGSGLEEQNVDAAVTVILDGGGNDITNQPLPPTGPRAFALAGGSIRVEWGYPPTTPAREPTGFHIYVTSPMPVGGPLRPASIIRRNKGNTRRLPGDGGDVRWIPGDGGTCPYGVPAATVLYSARIVNSFVCNLAGLADGTTYTIGVRAYNAIAEERNTNTVNVTADASGPAAVDSLTATATV
jgi:hypothetical protein